CSSAGTHAPGATTADRGGPANGGPLTAARLGEDTIVVALTWQTIVLLTIAYFIGCIVGCFARQLKGAGPVVHPHDMMPVRASVSRKAAPAPVVPATAVPAAIPAAPVPAPPPVVVQNAFRRADSDAPGVAPEPVPASPRRSPHEALP